MNMMNSGNEIPPVIFVRSEGIGVFIIKMIFISHLKIHTLVTQRVNSVYKMVNNPFDKCQNFFLFPMRSALTVEKLHCLVNIKGCNCL